MCELIEAAERLRHNADASELRQLQEQFNAREWLDMHEVRWPRRKGELPILVIPPKQPWRSHSERQLWIGIGLLVTIFACVIALWWIAIIHRS